MLAYVFEFVVSRRALTKNIAQKPEPLDIIHFQAMQSNTINNIKKWKVRKREKKRGNKSFELHAVHEGFLFSAFCTNLMWFNVSKYLSVCHIARRYRCQKLLLNLKTVDIYRFMSLHINKNIIRLKIKKWGNTRKTEKTRVRYNAGDILNFIFSVLHKKTPSENQRSSFLCI